MHTSFSEMDKKPTEGKMFVSCMKLLNDSYEDSMETNFNSPKVLQVEWQASSFNLLVAGDFRLFIRTNPSR